MFPIWLRSIFSRFFTYLTWRYIVIVFFCLWAMGVQLTYRVLGGFLFVLLPWVGLALSALSCILMLSHLLMRAKADDPFRQTFRRIEKWAELLIATFLCYSFFLFLNGNLDRSLPFDRGSEVLDIGGREIDIGINIPLPWVELRSWKHPEQTERLLLQGEEQARLWPGQPVVVQFRRGYFSVPWVLKVERDEEKYSREILKILPSAAEAWKNMINFYLEHQRWNEASTAAHEYLKIYPNDYDFALSVAAVFGQAARNAEAVALLEPFLARRRDYVLYNMVGFALVKLGDTKRGIELLEASIPLDPDSFWAYYHLGYGYRWMGRTDEAIAMFQKVLERRSNFPEIEDQVRRLQAIVSPPQSAHYPK